MTERESGFLGIEGTVHPIVQVGDPVLSTRCAAVTEFDDDLHRLLADMFASMYAADGVGLAANQIGVGRRVFVYDWCLSVRHQFHPLARPDHATVTGFDHTGAPIEVSGDGLLARCLQHEYDHLEGMLYIDRLSARARKKVLKAWAEEHQEL